MCWRAKDGNYFFQRQVCSVTSEVCEHVTVVYLEHKYLNPNRQFFPLGYKRKLCFEMWFSV